MPLIDGGRLVEAVLRTTGGLGVLRPASTRPTLTWRRCTAHRRGRALLGYQLGMGEGWEGFAPTLVPMSLGVSSPWGLPHPGLVRVDFFQWVR